MTSPVRYGVLTLSDRSSSGQRPDLSGPALVERIRLSGGFVQCQEVIPDDLELVSATLISWADSGDIDILLTTGSTGFSSRDVAPEATQRVIHRAAPGLAEAIRQSSLKITPFAMLSRAVSGIRGRTLIVNLPGSPKGAVESLEVILPVIQHAVQLLHDDRNAEAGHAANLAQSGI